MLRYLKFCSQTKICLFMGVDYYRGRKVLDNQRDICPLTICYKVNC